MITQLSLWEAPAEDMQVPVIGSIVAVRMPCGQEALAEIIRYYKKAFVDGLRVRWLPETGEYIRGYLVVWGEKSEGFTEGGLPFPPDPSEMAYWQPQMGDWRFCK